MTISEYKHQQTDRPVTIIYKPNGEVLVKDTRTEWEYSNMKWNGSEWIHV